MKLQRTNGIYFPSSEDGLPRYDENNKDAVFRRMLADCSAALSSFNVGPGNGRLLFVQFKVLIFLKKINFFKLLEPFSILYLGR